MRSLVGFEGLRRVVRAIRVIDTHLAAGSIRNARAAVEENLRRAGLREIELPTVPAAAQASEDSSRHALPFIAG